MMCFNHSSHHSVGVCKHCGRGVCHECVAPDLNSVACKDRCELHVKCLDRFIEKTILSRYSTTFIGSLLGGLLMVFLGFFISSVEGVGSYALILWVLAALFILNALRYISRRPDKP